MTIGPRFRAAFLADWQPARLAVCEAALLLAESAIVRPDGQLDVDPVAMAYLIDAAVLLRECVDRWRGLVRLPAGESFAEQALLHAAEGVGRLAAAVWGEDEWAAGLEALGRAACGYAAGRGRVEA